MFYSFLWKKNYFFLRRKTWGRRKDRKTRSFRLLFWSSKCRLFEVIWWKMVIDLKMFICYTGIRSDSLHWSSKNIKKFHQFFNKIFWYNRFYIDVCIFLCFHLFCCSSSIFMKEMKRRYCVWDNVSFVISWESFLHVIAFVLIIFFSILKSYGFFLLAVTSVFFLTFCSHWFRSSHSFAFIELRKK